MTSKIFIHALFIIFLVNHANAQEMFDNRSGISDKSNEFNISVFTGFSFLGAKNDIESNMSSSGLDDKNPAGWFGSSKAHPFTYKSPTFDIEATYYLSKKRGISLNIGVGDNIEVHGYENVGIGNFMFLKSELRSISLSYVYRSNNEKHNMFFGPSYFTHKVKDTSAGINSPNNKNEKLGFYLGYTLQVLRKKHWFIALKTNFRWAPKSEIGPFVAQHQLGIATENPEDYISEFSPTKVNLACLNVGVSIGFKSGK